MTFVSCFFKARRMTSIFLAGPCGTKEMVADALSESLLYPPFRTHKNMMCDAALQHATHCNMLQHAAHCNTLRTAAHCNTRSLIQHAHEYDARCYIATSDTLQHTATHCNTLQHTATRCNTLQHTATHNPSFRTQRNTMRDATSQQAPHCNTLQHAIPHSERIEIRCAMPHRNKRSRDSSYIQYAATHCNTLQHTATHCNTLQHTATHCNTLAHTAPHCNTHSERTEIRRAMPHHNKRC